MYQPTEDECDFSDPVEMENLVQTFDSVNINNNSIVDEPASGVPNFWLNIFKFVPMFDSLVKETDEPVLKVIHLFVSHLI